MYNPFSDIKQNIAHDNISLLKITHMREEKKLRVLHVCSVTGSADMPSLSYLKFCKDMANKQRWEFMKENRRVRKQELDQESDREKKESFFHFFLVAFLVELLFSCFLGRFLCRVLVFLFS